MDEVSKILCGMECSVARIDPDAVGIPAKGDIADMVAKGVSRSDLEELIADAEQVSESGLDELLQWQQDVVDGKWECLDWPQKSLGSLSRATLPGTVTILCADPGSGKSFLVLQLLRHWTKMGHKANVILFEDGKKEHLARLLAQMTENGDHTDDKWIKANVEQMRLDTKTYMEELALLDRKILVEKDDQWTGEDVLKWADDKGKAGARVLMLDPITALKPSKDPWIQDFVVCMGLKRIAKKYQLSVLVTTHPRNGTKEPAMTAMSGGVAWSRFTHSVLWLSAYRVPWEVRLADGQSAKVNRSMHILKCRYGRGDGCVIGMNFGHQVRHIEVGLIADDTDSDSRPSITNEEKQSRASRSKGAPNDSEHVF
jgi:KaiC/GvpD/RAD55 family RecA-like ATPase